MGDVIQSVPDNQNTLPRKFVDVSGNATYYAEEVVAVTSGTTVSKTGLSAHGTVDGTGTQAVFAGGVYNNWVTVQNNDPTNALYLSFSNPATVNDAKIAAAGGALTLPFGVANALYGLSGGLSTAFAIIGA